MGNRKEQTRTKEDAKLNTALYIRLSREDGDKAESLSVANQRMQLMEFMERQSDLRLHDVYVDDGHTGTNFERPAFKRMIEDIEAGNVQCVLVKDDCVILELNSESPENTGLCDVSSVF